MMHVQQERAVLLRLPVKRRMQLQLKKFLWNAKQHSQACQECTSFSSTNKSHLRSGSQFTSQKSKLPWEDVSNGVLSMSLLQTWHKMVTLKGNSALISYSHRNPESTSTWAKQQWLLQLSKRTPKNSWLQIRSRNRSVNINSHLHDSTLIKGIPSWNMCSVDVKLVSLLQLTSHFRMDVQTSQALSITWICKRMSTWTRLNR